jgi:hypothetical protein
MDADNSPQQLSGRIIQPCGKEEQHCRILSIDFSTTLRTETKYALPRCFSIMQTSELLLTILCGFLIVCIVAYQSWNRPQPRPVSTASTKAPSTAAPPIDASATASSTMKVPATSEPRKPFVVRVSGIAPGDASPAEASVRTAIASLSNDGSDCISDITIVPSCTDTETNVALVDFKELPGSLSSLKKGLSESRQVSGTDRSYIHFDAEFLGFTQMYSTKNKPTHE